MKKSVVVWYLTSDTDAGLQSDIFSNQDDLNDHFGSVIHLGVRGIRGRNATRIRKAIKDREIGIAYMLWQKHYKSELDAYNWGSEEIQVEV